MGKKPTTDDRAKTNRPRQVRGEKLRPESPPLTVRIGQALARLIGGPPDETEAPVRTKEARRPTDPVIRRKNPLPRPSVAAPPAATPRSDAFPPARSNRKAAPEARPESRPVTPASPDAMEPSRLPRGIAGRRTADEQASSPPTRKVPWIEPIETADSPDVLADEALDSDPPADNPWVVSAFDPVDETLVDDANADDDEEYAPPPAEPQRIRLGGAARHYAGIVEQTLAEFGVPVRVVHGETGPTLIRLGIAPGYIQRPARRDQPARRERVKAAKIVARANDLALALGVTSLRIEAPVPGKSYIGIEVPNPNPKAVPLAPLLEDPEFGALAERGVLPFALGRGVSGPPIVADLARLPHLLIAGATGSGKSVAVNSLIGTLLQTRSPAQVRIVVVDPKRVEFTWLERVPHLLTPVVTEPEKAVDVLGKVESEMAHRYDVLAAAGCRNRLTYNAKGHPPLPALVVVVDELADLMMLASDEVERSICRVAQLGRAAGIHLVVATQRPSVDVITGLIKANLPARLAFAVSSLVDSRTILDTPGAERLLGRGDFLYLSPDAMRPVRGQGAWAKDSWLNSVVRKARETVPPGTPDPEGVRFANLMSAAQIAEDRLYLGARELAQEHPKVSASYLQRKLRIGYNKAVALIERLRADGIIADPELDDE